MMAPIVGAHKKEVAIMETLTANLHLMMSSFYRPTKERYKIILEDKAFPSDHVGLPSHETLSRARTTLRPVIFFQKKGYVRKLTFLPLQFAVESQLRHYGLDPRQAIVLIDPIPPKKTLTNNQIYKAINDHAEQTALVLLPGIQYYSGQLLDIKAITAHAHSKSIMIGWDLAHAVGNVDLKLNQWQVDFAVWCTYKYLNSGPGSIAGLFVHEKHGKVDRQAVQEGQNGYRPRLSGWWGSDKDRRFEMENSAQTRCPSVEEVHN